MVYSPAVRRACAFLFREVSTSGVSCRSTDSFFGIFSFLVEEEPQPAVTILDPFNRTFVVPVRKFTEDHYIAYPRYESVGIHTVIIDRAFYRIRREVRVDRGKPFL